MIYHNIAIYVPFTIILPYMCQEQICPSNDTGANYFMCRNQTTMSVYVHHRNSMQSTVSPESFIYLHFTLLVYASEQIYLSNYTCRFYSTNNDLHVDSILLFIYVKACNFIYHAIAIHVQTTHILLKCHIYATYVIYFMCKYETTMSVYIPHMISMQ